MPCRYANATIFLTGLVLPSVPTAPPTASCKASFTSCGIRENILLQLAFRATAGDAVLNEPYSTAVSAVFRIFNNLVNTELGTGLGNMVFLYSSDDTTLPAPSSCGANAAFITEAQSGITSYLRNGATYLLALPEPQAFGLISLGISAVAVLARRCLRTL